MTEKEFKQALASLICSASMGGELAKDGPCEGSRKQYQNADATCTRLVTQFRRLIEENARLTAEIERLNSEYEAIEAGCPPRSVLDRISNHADGWVFILSYVTSLWHSTGWWLSPHSRQFEFGTGGHPRNEALIEALRANRPLWDTCWKGSAEPTLYLFYVPEGVY